MGSDETCKVAADTQLAGTTAKVPWYHGATVHLFADANPLFALIPKPKNQPLHNNYAIIVYRIIWYN